MVVIFYCVSPETAALVGMLNLVLELVESLAGTEDSVDSRKDEAKDEGVDLGLDEIKEVEQHDVKKSSTSIAGKGHVAVKLHARRHDVGSDDGSDGKDVSKEEIGCAISADRHHEHCDDKDRDVVKEVRGEVDPQTIKGLTSILGQAVLGVEVVLLHLIEIHFDCFFF